MLSNKAKYGLKALIHLAGHEGVSLAATIAEENKIPRKFLDAILLELTKAGILTARKARAAAISWRAPPTRSPPGRSSAFSTGRSPPIACASRTAYRPCPDCPDEAACAVRDVMLDVRDSMALILDRTSIAAMRARRQRAPRRSGDLSTFR